MFSTLSRSYQKLMSFGMFICVAGSLNCTGFAQTEHGTLLKDGCYYHISSIEVNPSTDAPQVQWKRQGCRVSGADGRLYYRNEKDGTWEDEQTKYVYVLDQSSRWLIQMTNGNWVDAYAVPGQQPPVGTQQRKIDPAALQRLEQASDANSAPMPTAGVPPQTPAQPNQQQNSALTEIFKGRIQQSQDNSERTREKMLSGDNCYGESNYEVCRRNEQLTNGYDCLGRDRNTQHCQAKARDRADTKKGSENAAETRIRDQALRDKQAIEKAAAKKRADDAAQAERDRQADARRERDRKH